MSFSVSVPLSDFLSEGANMMRFMRDLYPICRSITGDGLRQTLHRIQKEIPIVIQEVPTGKPVFDWTIPLEWNIRDAYIKNSRGDRVVDFQKNNLHVVSYSIPVHQKMSLQGLREHLHTLPEHPDWIPYRTTYYKEDWGFCLAHRELQMLPEGEYEVLVDSTLAPGSLSYGELVLAGEHEDEVLLSCHCCHPSLCNDNLSGIAVALFLAKHLAALEKKYTYRFLFIPGTIGAITWLAQNESQISRIRHGLVLTGLGDRGPLTYKKSRRGDAEMDRVAAHILRHCGESHQILDFSPYGYDERQYCSPGFDLPVGRLSRTPHGTFPEYHTSADNLDFVSADALGRALAACISIVHVLEMNRTFQNLNPKCEPQLGKRGLYRSLGGRADAGEMEMAFLWILNLSDGGHSLLDIAERANLPFAAVVRAANLLMENGLLKELCEWAPSPVR